MLVSSGGGSYLQTNKSKDGNEQTHWGRFSTRLVCGVGGIWCRGYPKHVRDSGTRHPNVPRPLYNPRIVG